MCDRGHVPGIDACASGVNLVVAQVYRGNIEPEYSLHPASLVHGLSEDKGRGRMDGGVRKLGRGEAIIV